jgi:hypothetical protein
LVPISIAAISSGWVLIRWSQLKLRVTQSSTFTPKIRFWIPPVQATRSLLEKWWPYRYPGAVIMVLYYAWLWSVSEEWWRQFCYRLKMAGYDG